MERTLGLLTAELTVDYKMTMWT